MESVSIPLELPPFEVNGAIFFIFDAMQVRLTLTSDRSDLEGGPSLWRTEEGDKHRSLKFRAICSGAYFAAQGLRVS